MKDDEHNVNEESGKDDTPASSSNDDQSSGNNKEEDSQRSLAKRQENFFQETKEEVEVTRIVDPREGRDAIYRNITRIKNNRAIGVFEKKKFVAEQIKELFRVEQLQLQVASDCTSELVKVRLEEFKLGLNNSFLQLFERLGVEVSKRQLDILANFGEELTAFSEDLAKRPIAPKYRDKILKKTDVLFDRMYDKMDEMAKGIIMGPDENR